MKAPYKIALIITFAISLNTYGQWQNSNKDILENTSNSIKKELPKISKDSTIAEISEHVKATIEWMSEQHYKYNYAPPLIYSETALKLAEKSKDSLLLHKTRSILGNIMLRVNDTANARKLFYKSLADAEKTNDSTLILASKGNLANAYYYTKNYNHKAIRNYIEGSELATKLNDTARAFIMRHNVSRIFIENEDVENLKQYIEEARTYLDFLDNPYYKSSHLRNEGMLYVLLKEPDTAIEKFKENISIAEELEFMDGLIDGYKGWIMALELKADYEGIYKINKKLKKYTDKKAEEEANQTTEAVAAKINVERYKDQIKSKELEKELLEHQAEKKNILLFIILGVVISLLIILGTIFSAYKKRKVLVEDLRKRNAQYLLAKNESEQNAKAKSKFFATVSHELRTPLYGVIGISSLLMENNELKKHKKDLNSLKFSANYLLALINDLLHMNKIDNGKFPDEEVSFNLRELVNTITSSFEYIRVQHQNQFQVNISDEIPTNFQGNATRLSQILMNLVGNACKFTEKGTITIGINLNQINEEVASINFTVKDTGVGIKKEKLDSIFDEFTQINSKNISEISYQGTGLGLPIVKKLIDQTGNTISVKSKVGKGTEFNFCLQLKIESEAVKHQKNILDTSLLAEKKILIVEDNRINQTVTKRILEKQNVVCEIAQNGDEAIDMVYKNLYDLILMDINMPVKNGIEATIEIRKFNEITPIVALTAVEIEEQKFEIFKSGMNDIIVKPYDIDIFKQTILRNLTDFKSENFQKLAL